MKENFIYALKCPLTDEIKYVGQTINGITRPLEHIINKSHSSKVNAWVNGLSEMGLSPHIIILEKELHRKELNSREIYWIHYYIKAGHKLLNVSHYDFDLTVEKHEENPLNMLSIAKFVKVCRRKMGYTQPQFSKLAGVGLRFLRELEQGKDHIRMDKVLQCTNILGGTIGIVANK